MSTHNIIEFRSMKHIIWSTEGVKNLKTGMGYLVTKKKSPIKQLAKLKHIRKN